MEPSSRQAVSLLILLTFTLFAAPLLTRSLQTDEASSIWFTRLPWATFLTDFCDPHPPGYYLFLKFWLTAGTQAAWSRLLSLWAVLLAIAITLRLGREWQNARTGLLAAALLAFQPLTLWYATQTRMYAFVLFLGVLTFWLAWRLWQGNGRSLHQWLLYWLAASALLWTDFTGLFVWGLLQLIWLAAGRPHFRRWLLTQTAVLLPYLLLLPLLPASQTLSHSYQPVFVAVQAMKLGIHLPPDQAAIFLLIALTLVAALGILIAAIGPRLYRRWPTTIHAVLALLLTGGWLLLIFAASVPRLYTLKRLLVPLLPALALATAAITTAWPPRRAAAIILPGLLVCLIFLPRHQSEAWQTAVPEITKNAPQGAQFWVDDMVVPAFAYYAGSEMASRWEILNGRSLPQLPTADPGAPLFLVTTNTPYRELLPLLPPAFYQTYQLVGEHIWPGIHIYEFQPRTAASPVPLPAPPPSLAAKWGLLLPSPLATCQTP